MEKLYEINKIAAKNASRALSKLIDRSVQVDISELGEKKVEELSRVFDPEEIVVGIYLPVTGDLKGAAILVLPKETAFNMSDLLVKREIGTTRRLSELDKSALKEAANIVSGSYLSVIANMLRIKVTEHIPNFSLDMFGAIVKQTIADLAREIENALVIKIKFIFEPKTLEGYFFLILRSEEINALLEL